MTITEYINQRKNRKPCKPRKKTDTSQHPVLGKILLRERDERDRMEIDRREILKVPESIQGFIY